MRKNRESARRSRRTRLEELGLLREARARSAAAESHLLSSVAEMLHALHQLSDRQEALVAVVLSSVRDVAQRVSALETVQQAGLRMPLPVMQS